MADSQDKADQGMPSSEQPEQQVLKRTNQPSEIHRAATMDDRSIRRFPKADLDPKPPAGTGEVTRARLLELQAEIRSIEAQLQPKPPGITLEEYKRMIDQATNTTEQTKDIFRWFADRMAAIGTTFLPPGETPQAPVSAEVWNRCAQLMRELTTKAEQTDEFAEKMEQLKTLAAFNVNVPDEYLFTNFRVRARMIVQQCSLPERAEHDLLHHLTILYQSLIYTPFMEFIGQDDDTKTLEPRMMSMLTTQHEVLMYWMTRYNEWVGLTRELRDVYTMPLLQRIVSSRDEKAWEEVSVYKGAKKGVIKYVETYEKSGLALRRGGGGDETPGYSIFDDGLISALSIDVE